VILIYTGTSDPTQDLGKGIVLQFMSELIALGYVVSGTNGYRISPSKLAAFEAAFREAHDGP